MTDKSIADTIIFVGICVVEYLVIMTLTRISLPLFKKHFEHLSSFDLCTERQQDAAAMFWFIFMFNFLSNVFWLFLDKIGKRIANS